MSLPNLPIPVLKESKLIESASGVLGALYTADQVKAYGQQCWQESRKALADEQAQTVELKQPAPLIFGGIAARERMLKESVLKRWAEPARSPATSFESLIGATQHRPALPEQQAQIEDLRTQLARRTVERDMAIQMAACGEQAQEVEPVAFLKTWDDGAKTMQRVDMTPKNEDWLDRMSPKLTPLYPPPAEPTIKQPLSTERAELIARHRVMTKTMTSYGLDTCAALCLESADMLEADGTFIDEGTKAPQLAVPAWMPIETAPKDGQCLLWVDTDDGGEVMTLLRDSNGCWLYEGKPVYSASFYIEPTHWMPLPQPPQGEKTCSQNGLNYCHCL